MMIMTNLLQFLIHYMMDVFQRKKLKSIEKRFDVTTDNQGLLKSMNSISNRRPMGTYKSFKPTETSLIVLVRK